MAHVLIENDHLLVKLQGWHQVWALTRAVRVPVDHVRGATADPGIVHEPKGLRAPGLHVPGAAVIGTFTRDGERNFWGVRDGSHAIVIELAQERFTRLVVDVEHPRAVVDLINQATSRVS